MHSSALTKLHIGLLTKAVMTPSLGVGVGPGKEAGTTMFFGLSVPTDLTFPLDHVQYTLNTGPRYLLERTHVAQESPF
jgi:hypothetical protein